MNLISDTLKRSSVSGSGGLSLLAERISFTASEIEPKARRESPADTRLESV